MSEWTRLAQRIHCVVEMDKPLTVRRERWTLVQGDENANTIVAEVFQSTGKPYDLTGCTVTLTFVRPDHLAAPPITAEVNGNVAAATLTDACYRVSGKYNAVMQIAKDGADRTILWLIGDVLANENDGVVDEEGVFPTPEEMLVIFQQVEQAKQDANAAALTANSAASRANKAAGDAEIWANTEANAKAIAADKQPTVNISESNGKKVFSFGIPAGKTPQITFRVATGEPGTQVQMQQSGTPETPVIDLTIPRGDTGAVDGIDYYAGNPSALGEASPGTANGVARGNHVHPMPTAEQVGALPAGGTAVNAASAENAKNAENAKSAENAKNAEKLGGKTPDQYLSADGTVSNAEKLGGKAPEYYLRPRNLFANSNFRNPVNQRGQKEYQGNVPSIDRWWIWEPNGVGKVTIGSNGVTLHPNGGQEIAFSQHFEKGVLNAERYTLAVCDGNGDIHIFYDAIGRGEAFDFAQFVGSTDTTFQWALLCEGIYTKETLASYMPKSYAEELMECRRYYYKVSGNEITRIANQEDYAFPVFSSGVVIAFPVTMRVVPTTVIAYDVNDGQEQMAPSMWVNKNTMSMPNVTIDPSAYFDVHWVEANADL